jgi:hypothetical protein
MLRYVAPAALSVSRTTGGVIGARRIRTPVASKKALAIAAGVGSWVSSPPPLGGTSGRFTTTTVVLGASLKRRIGYETQSRLVTSGTPAGAGLRRGGVGGCESPENDQQPEAEPSRPCTLSGTLLACRTDYVCRSVQRT